MIETEFKTLESSLSSFSEDLFQQEGRRKLLSEQLFSSKEKIISLETNKTTEIKAVELLHVIERSSRDVVVKAFEQTVTYALRAIYQSEGYAFKLEFSQRGNISELDFKLKSPTTQGYLDLKETSCGGELDIVSLALRFVLIQVIRPCIEGPITLDEPTKMVSSNLRENEFKFYQFLADKFKRQLIIVSHSKELSDLATNKIVIGETDGN